MNSLVMMSFVLMPFKSSYIFYSYSTIKTFCCCIHYWVKSKPFLILCTLFLAGQFRSHTDCVSMFDFWDVLFWVSIQIDIILGNDWQVWVKIWKKSRVRRARYFSTREVFLKWEYLMTYITRSELKVGKHWRSLTSCLKKK
jgi:hypothetical protein